MKKILATAALSAAVGATALVPTPATAVSHARGASGQHQPRGGARRRRREVRPEVGRLRHHRGRGVRRDRRRPAEPGGLLADGKTRLTAFIPTDKAFRNLVKDLTGKKLGTEKKVFKAVAGLGLDTVEAVLLYHVVPGKTITAAQALDADGASLPTALTGASLTVRWRTATSSWSTSTRTPATRR